MKELIILFVFLGISQASQLMIAPNATIWTLIPHALVCILGIMWQRKAYQLKNLKYRNEHPI